MLTPYHSSIGASVSQFVLSVQLSPSSSSYRISNTGRSRERTIVVKDCIAERPPGSVAVTVTSALPGDTPVTVTVLPDTDAVATPGSDVVAA